VKESKILKLKTPIMRDDKPVHEITLREPSAGELRGIRLFELTQGDAEAVIKLLPRISSPALTPAEANKLGLRDFARAMILVAEMFALDDEDGEVVGKPSPAA
jgi:phage tail protein E